MEPLGKYLKGVRESRNLSLKEVSESTEMKERLLKAIEEDQYELLYSPVYVEVSWMLMRDTSDSIQMILSSGIKNITGIRPFQ